MEVNDFEILLIDVRCSPQHVQKLVFNVLIKNEKRLYSGPGVKALSSLYNNNTNDDMISRSDWEENSDTSLQPTVRT